LKPLQNKKGQKKIPGAQFSVSFSQPPAVKKDTENCAHGNFFGTSYFVMTLVASMGYLSIKILEFYFFSLKYLLMPLTNTVKLAMDPRDPWWAQGPNSWVH
jgi:hypothetical protein